MCVGKLVEVREQLAGTNSLLLPRGCQGLNSIFRLGSKGPDPLIHLVDSEEGTLVLMHTPKLGSRKESGRCLHTGILIPLRSKAPHLFAGRWHCTAVFQVAKKMPMTPRKLCAESRRCLLCSTTWTRWVPSVAVGRAWTWVCGRGLLVMGGTRDGALRVRSGVWICEKSILHLGTSVPKHRGESELSPRCLGSVGGRARVFL